MAARNHEQPPKEATKEDKEDKEETTTNEGVNQRSEDRPTACRRLDFGDVEEAAKINAALQLSSEELHEQRQKAIEKWNFDFENEVPLDGDWEWERVPVQLTESKEIVCCVEKRCSDNRTV